MDIVAIIISLVLGAVGGIGIGQMVKGVNLGTVGNVVAGAIGGIVLVWISAYIPGLAGIVGAGAESQSIGTWIGQAIVGLIGGGILTAIAGGIRNAMGTS
jgi:hypothetical protein